MNIVGLIVSSLIPSIISQSSKNEMIEISTTTNSSDLDLSISQSDLKNASESTESETITITEQDMDESLIFTTPNSFESIKNIKNLQHSGMMNNLPTEDTLDVLEPATLGAPQSSTTEETIPSKIEEILPENEKSKPATTFPQTSSSKVKFTTDESVAIPTKSNESTEDYSTSQMTTNSVTAIIETFTLTPVIISDDATFLRVGIYSKLKIFL
jgi:hypothetical protein